MSCGVNFACGNPKEKTRMLLSQVNERRNPEDFVARSSYRVTAGLEISKLPGVMCESSILLKITVFNHCTIFQLW